MVKQEEVVTKGERDYEIHEKEAILSYLIRSSALFKGIRLVVIYLNICFLFG